MNDDRRRNRARRDVETELGLFLASKLVGLVLGLIAAYVWLGPS